MPPVGRSARDQLGVEIEEHIEPQMAAASSEPEPEPVESRPEWLPEKFKDESEFAASYSSLEDELRRRGETEREMRDQLESLTEALTALNAPQQQPQDQSQLTEQLQNAYENDPIGTMVYLAQQVADERYKALQAQQQPQLVQQQQLQGELIASTAERVMETRFEDWSSYAPKVGEMIERNPLLLPNDALTSVDKTTSALESIYKQVKYDDLVRQQAGQISDQSRMKEQAQTLSGGVTRPGAPSEVDEKIAQLVAAAKGNSWAAHRNGA